MKRPHFIASYKKIARSPSLCGFKASHLAFLHLKGFNVPPFIVISTKSFFEFEDEAVRRLFRQRLLKIFQSQGIQFPQGKIAVRSSAPYEDAKDTSLAGQLESVLDVSDEQELIKAIITVKSSAASNKIKSYSRHVKGESRSTETAVIIQQQIEPEISGVLFTSHPLSHQDLMVIEAVRGPCANLVTGRTSPKQFIIDKSAHQIIDQIEGDYADLVVDPERLNELIQLGATVERLFHQPMDIEWGFARNRLWLFQARPITVLQQSKIRLDQKKREWTNFFFAERFDRPVSPLAWSFLFPLISRRALADPLWYLGKEKLFKRSTLIAQFEGVPYARLDAFRALYSIIPYRLLPADKRQFFSPQHHKQLYLIYRSLPAIVSRLLIQDPQWIPWLNLGQWRRFSRVCEKQIIQLNKQLEQADLEKLCDILESTHRLSDHFLSIHRWSITFADLFAELLYHFLQKTLQRGNLVQDLLSGLPGNASVQAETALDALDVENKDEVQKFINCYGHRSQSLDFSLPTWGESIYAIKKLRTDAPLELLKEKNKEIYLRHNELFESLQKLLEIKYGVAAFLFKAIYKMVYNAAAQFVSCRENQRDLWQKILYISRRSALKIGRILQSKGVLDSPQEIFFLHYSEIRAAVKGDALDFPVQKRKNEFEIWVGKTINTQVKEADLECRAPDHKVLFGIGVSAGTVTGRARVIKTFEEALSAETNEIIVAPAVDPGWTPVFAQISGLVLEYGGLLSHAAIIAREFHLPAVTGIPEVTRIIKTGDLIAIDGQHGIVKLLQKPS